MMGNFRLKPMVAALAAALATHQAAGQVPAPATLPTGGRVVAGQATIIQSGSAMNIQQDSAKAILNWNSFSIGSQASVNFQQPSSSSIALNRVLGSDPSSIYGSLTANGQVFLINPNGVVFGAGARVDVNGLVASTLNIRDTDFLSGNFRFTRDGATGSVVNQGELLGRYVALLAPEVRNEGVIVARQGTAVLAAGEAVTLGITGNDLIGVQVDQASIDTLVLNGRLIQAEQGMVILSAQSAHGLVGKVVNTDAIEAKGITTDGGVVRLVASSAIEHGGSITADAGRNGKGGEVILLADLANPNSRTTVSGSISARGGSEGGDGGFVETSASKLRIEDSFRVDTRAPHGETGQWLLDPEDFTVAATGGDITGTLLGTLLGSNSVTIQTGTGTDTATDRFGASGTIGDVFVNDSVSWAANTLTINANRDINVNAAMTITGTGGLAVKYGQGAVAASNTANFTVNAPVNMATGTTFTSLLGSDGALQTYNLITDLAGLVAINTNSTTVAANYVLGANVAIPGGTLWAPIGNTVGPLQGIFEGLGHTVSGAKNDPRDTAFGGTSTDNVGFFGQTGNSALIRNFGVTNVDMQGKTAVGGLVGNNSGAIYNSYSTGVVQYPTDLTGITTLDTVTGVGGLVGQNAGGAISRSYSTATVTATAGTQTDDLGGGPIVYGGGIGGLIGMHVGGRISDSYATGSVTGLNNVGGLVGHAAVDIDRSYSTGAVSDNGSGLTVGGLIGSVPGFPAVPPTITGSFWDTQTSGQATSAGSEAGKTTAEMKTAATFTGAGWDTARVWRVVGGNYPGFGSLVLTTTPIYIRLLTGGTSIYGNTPLFTLSNFGFFTTAGAGTTISDANPTGSIVLTGMPTFTSPVGNHSVVYASGLTLGNGNYTLLAGSAVDWLVTARPLTVTGQTATSRVYDATTAAALAGGSLSGVVNGDTVTLVSGTGAFATKDVGTNKAVTVTGTGLAGGGAGNYSVSNPTGLTADITKANLAVTGLAASNKTYDATIAAILTGTATVTGLLTDDVTAGGTAAGTFANKNFGTGKAVTVSGVTISGADAGNYNVVQQTGLTADITKANLTVTGLSASNKVYDAGIVATVTGTATVTGLLTDDVTAGGTAAGTFANKNFGTGKAVTVSGVTISGADAGNYNVVQQTGLTADITKANLTVTGLSASNKVYDAGIVATVTGTAAVTALGADVVTVGGVAAGTFADKNVGTGKAVTVTGNTLGGGDAGNYNIVQQTGLTADITKANLTVSGLAASNKVYDATTAATLTGTASVTALLTDVVTVGGTAAGTFADKNVANGKAVTVTGNTLGGADAGNYNVVQQGGLTANITPANLTLSGTRTYDATTVVAGSVLTASGVGGETFGVTGAGDASNLASRNVGTAPRPLASVTNLALGTSTNGGLAGNYNALGTAGSSVMITQKALEILGLTIPSSVTGATAGPVGLNGTPALMNAVAPGMSAAGAPYTGDVLLPFAGTAQGTSFTVSGQTLTGSVGGLTLNGAGAGNYTLTGARVTGNVPASTGSTDSTVQNVINSELKPTQTTTTRATTTTTRATTTPAPTEEQSTTSTVAMESDKERPSEEPIQSAARTSSTIVLAGRNVGVTADFNGDGQSPPPAGTAVSVQVRPAIEGSDAVFTATATVNADGTVSVDVNVPEGSPPGVYLVVLVIPATADSPARVAIGALVVRRSISS